jgi:hypothetical protein
MIKVGTYKIIADKQLIIEYYSGNTVIEDFIHLKEIITTEPEYDFTYSVLFDVSDADLKISESDLKKLIDYLKVKFDSKKKKVAYLTKGPNDVVQTTLFLNLVNNCHFNVIADIFSTIQGAAKWLNIENVNKEYLETKLSELKTQPTNVFKKNNRNIHEK